MKFEQITLIIGLVLLFIYLIGTTTYFYLIIRKKIKKLDKESDFNENELRSDLEKRKILNNNTNKIFKYCLILMCLIILISIIILCILFNPLIKSALF
ncbi:hypothetical protein [Williamsoniiplasma lucivorax]|uniref:Uncharacterized protein n=1 Tax=Williamsoniiplasma lucivorax TaxID=209274 RepID=A0A2S5RF70_9MOLU|nr:hypothetical protein [Williamsoniiplasma lucivorax]PPE05964.1 hypothetical protein ELUCI_v1c02550 [Williamsoniiplasma lucivorax]